MKLSRKALLINNATQNLGCSSVSCLAEACPENARKVKLPAYKAGSFTKSRISDDTATDDIFQNVFLKMHTGLASLKDKTKHDTTAARELSGGSHSGRIKKIDAEGSRPGTMSIMCIMMILKI